MPSIIERIGGAIKGAQNPQSVVSDTPHRYEGFNDSGVVLSDRRGTKKTGIPTVNEKSGTMGDDPLAIYKPTGAKHVNAAKAMGNFSNWTYAAVNAIASEISNIQWRLFAISGDKHEEQQDHPLLTILEGVNPNMTGIELKYMIAAHLELTGNVFMLLDGVKNDTDQPKALYLLDPGRMKVKVDKSTFPYKLSHYEMTYDGKIFTFKPYQIVHLKYPDPSDPFVGIGVPQATPTWVDTDNYAMEYNRKFFINGAGVGMYIATQTNVEGQIDRIRKGFDEKYAGVENAHRVPVLPKGVDLKNAGASNRDMDMKNLLDMTGQRVIAAHRVSKTILGTAESDTNRATAETADYVFSKRTIKPKMLLIVSFLNAYLVPRYGDNLYLTFLDPVPEDKAARTTEMQAAVASMPVMTQNEARRNFMGLGPIEGGDKLLMPSTMELAGTTSEVEGEDQSPNLAKSKTVEGWDTKPLRIRTGGKTQYSAAYEFRTALSKAFAEAIANKEIDLPNVKNVTDLTKSEYMEYYKRFDERSSEAEKDLEVTFRGINAKQKEAVMENLSKATGVKAWKKAVGDIFDLEEWIHLTIDLVTPILAALSKDEAIAALQMIGASIPEVNYDTSIREQLDKGIQKMAKSYNQTTLDQIKKAIGDELSKPDGTSLDRLKEAVSDVYEFADARRAGLIAKTEAYRAGNLANKIAWQATGQVKTIKWYTAEDSRVCVFCSAMEDTGTIAIDSTFANDGDTITGTDGTTMTLNYGDIEAPPLHPDCRCYIRPEDITL